MIISWSKGHIPWNKGKKLPGMTGMTGINNPMYGKPRSEEVKKRISKARKGQSPWNKGGHFSEEAKRNMSKAAIGRISPNKGKTFSEEHKKHLSESKKGRKHSEEDNRRNSERQKGAKNPNWRGGIAHEPYSVDWTATLKRSIRERDHYICQLCGALQNDVAFHCHHIDYDKKNCNPDNLILLCSKCHGKTNYNKEFWIKYFLGRE